MLFVVRFFYFLCLSWFHRFMFARAIKTFNAISSPISAPQRTTYHDSRSSDQCSLLLFLYQRSGIRSRPTPSPPTLLSRCRRRATPLGERSPESRVHVPPVGVGAAHGLEVPGLDHQREHALRSAERRGRQRRGEARNVADPGRARDLSMSWACQGRALHTSRSSVEDARPTSRSARPRS